MRRSKMLLGKIKIQLKDPDGVGEAISNKITELVKDFDLDDQELLLESREEKVRDILEKWVEWGEHITVEIDLDTQSAYVLSVDNDETPPIDNRAELMQAISDIMIEAEDSLHEITDMDDIIGIRNALTSILATARGVL